MSPPRMADESSDPASPVDFENWGAADAGKTQVRARLPGADTNPHRLRLEDLASLDIRPLARAPEWGTGGAQWSELAGRRDAELRVEVSSWPGAVLLRTFGCGRAGPVVGIVLLAATACHLGGERPWFLCSRCSGRAALLYWWERRWQCRGCVGLLYRSQQRRAGSRGQ